MTNKNNHHPKTDRLFDFWTKFESPMVFLNPICSHNFQSTHAPHMFSFKVEIHLEHQAVLPCTSIAQGGTQSATVRKRHGSWHTRVFSKAAQRSMCFGALGHQPSALIMDVVEGNGRCWRKWKRGMDEIHLVRIENWYRRLIPEHLGTILHDKKLWAEFDTSDCLPPFTNHLHTWNWLLPSFMKKIG